jgi:hypothetical protein
LPVALVEERRRAQWCPPGTTDSLGARKAKVLALASDIVHGKGERWVELTLRQSRGHVFSRGEPSPQGQ